MTLPAFTPTQPHPVLQLPTPEQAIALGPERWREAMLKREAAIKDEVAQKRVDDNPVSNTEVIITGTGEYMCYDTYTGRYFKSSQEIIRRAENDTFKQVLDESYASLNDFFDRLSLPHNAVGEEVGFTYDNNIEISFSSTISDDGQPCLAITYVVSPVRNYFRIR